LSNESGAVLTEQKEAPEDSAYAMTMEDYLHYDQEAFKTPNHGDIVDGIVVRVDADEVLVDIGAKAEGVISSKELGNRGDVDSVGLQNIYPGAFFLALNDGSYHVTVGYVRLTYHW